MSEQSTPTTEQPVEAEQPYKRPLPRVLGVNYIMNRQYKRLDIDGAWLESFGHLSDPFRMLVYGLPKNGKTTLIMSFCKYLTRFGKVFYDSIEEGDSSTIQDAYVRAKMDELPDGKFMLGDRFFFADLVEYLKKPNSGRFVVIDSRDYINLTSLQWKKLTVMFPKKSFILICWEAAGKPLGKFAKDIEFMVDVVVHVKNHRAKAVGRFGGGKEYVIWDKKPVVGEQLKIVAA
jgi:predicted ATP-dependent serine protease